ncbi:hypothetical protein [Corynebacterium callunae]|uniref:hypothetical protein n=1 Tax=Corynebacterium callunae TaxID=1721 RepID=UPI001FFFDF33|nr:hypothetical protein [Corynebacterium callunae]MCK2199655.1 hypothetical protein [Corynebacterium callunae]
MLLIGVVELGVVGLSLMVAGSASTFGMEELLAKAGLPNCNQHQQHQNRQQWGKTRQRFHRVCSLKVHVPLIGQAQNEMNMRIFKSKKALFDANLASETTASFTNFCQL